MPFIQITDQIHFVCCSEHVLHIFFFRVNKMETTKKKTFDFHCIEWIIILSHLIMTMMSMMITIDDDNQCAWVTSKHLFSSVSFIFRFFFSSELFCYGHRSCHCFEMHKKRLAVKWWKCDIHPLAYVEIDARIQFKRVRHKKIKIGKQLNFWSYAHAHCIMYYTCIFTLLFLCFLYLRRHIIFSRARPFLKRKR